MVLGHILNMKDLSAKFDYVKGQKVVKGITF